MKKITTIFILFFLALNAFSQGTLRGKVTDEKGNALFNAKVFFKSDKTIIALSDFDGNFSIDTKSSTPDVLVISLLDFITLEDTIQFTNSNLITQDFTLLQKLKTMETVVFKKKKVKGKNMEI